MYRRSGRKRVPTSRANNGGAAAAAKKSKQQQEEATANIADRLPRTSGTPPVQLGSNTVTTNVLPHSPIMIPATLPAETIYPAPGHATVWIVGSSIIKHAFGEARGRPGGVNLGLQRMGVNIWWQGKCGGKVLDMKQQIRTMLKYEDPPTILVLHIGGNDIGEKSSKTLCELIRKQFSWMRQLMLDTVFVWSQIIPRSSWRYSDNINAMEKCRMRVNTSIASFLTKTDGCYLRYPDIKANELFLMKDGVHLTSLGNNIFLNTLQGGLEMIIRNLGINLTFPDCK
ncbi:uncharacterized protein [Mytilus edulis]